LFVPFWNFTGLSVSNVIPELSKNDPSNSLGLFRIRVAHVSLDGVVQTTQRQPAAIPA